MGFKARHQLWRGRTTEEHGAIRLEGGLIVPPRVRPELLLRNGREHGFLCWPDRHDVRYLVVERPRRKGDERPPYRGRVRTGIALGRSAYDYHNNLPVEGVGMGIACLSILECEPDGTLVRTPYREWRRSLGVIVRCNRCGVDLATDDASGCRWRPRRDSAVRARLAAHPMMETI